MTIGIAIDPWKKRTFLRALASAGFKDENIKVNTLIGGKKGALLISILNTDEEGKQQIGKICKKQKIDQDHSN